MSATKIINSTDHCNAEQRGFYEEDIGIIPPSTEEDVRQCLEFGLERERYWHVLWPKMVRQQIWLRDEEKKSPIVVPELPPHDQYLTMGCDGLLGGRKIDDDVNPPSSGSLWPRGCNAETANVWQLCKAYILWTMTFKPLTPYAKKEEWTEFDKVVYAMYQDSWWTFYASFLIGLLSPIVAIWINLVTDEINIDAGDPEMSLDQKSYIAIISISLLLLSLIVLRLQYYWNVRIPGQAQQQHLRWVMMSRLLPKGMEGDIRRCDGTNKDTNRTAGPPTAVTPGAAMAVLGPAIETANENIVQAFFKLIVVLASEVANLIVTFLMLIYPSDQMASPYTIAIVCGVIVISSATNLLLFRFYLLPLQRLVRLTSQWQVRFYSLGVEQLSNPKGHDDEHPRSKDLCSAGSATDAVDIEKGVDTQRIDENALQQRAKPQKQSTIDEFWVVTRLYRYRKFQSDIKVLVVEDFVGMMMQLMNVAFVVVLAYEVINPNTQVSIGTFTALSYISSTRASNSQQMLEILCNIPEGYRALQQVAQIVNYGSTNPAATNVPSDPVHPICDEKSNTTTTSNDNSTKPEIFYTGSPGGTDSTDGSAFRLNL